MAPSDTEPLQQMIENVCFYCERKVVDAISCAKCKEMFHPACLKQSAARKSAVCVHTAVSPVPVVRQQDNNSTCTCLAKEVEITYLKRLLYECESKNRLLEENNSLLREKIEKSEIRPEKCASKGQKMSEKASSSRKQSSTLTLVKGVEVNLTHTEKMVGQNTNTVTEAGNAVGSGAENSTTETEVSSRTEVASDELLLSNDLWASRSNDSAVCNGQQKVTTRNKQEAAGDCQHRRAHNLLGEEVIVTEPRPAVAEAVDADGREDAWTKVRPTRRKRRARADGEVMSDRPKPQRGLLEGVAGLEVADDFSWLFVSGLAPETEPQQILDYLGKNGVLDRCLCTKMKTRRDGQRSSFKLAVPRQISKKVMSGEMWPRGVLVNHFLNIQRHQSQHP